MNGVFVPPAEVPPAEVNGVFVSLALRRWWWDEDEWFRNGLPDSKAGDPGAEQVRFGLETWSVSPDETLLDDVTFGTRSSRLGVGVLAGGGGTEMCDGVVVALEPALGLSRGATEVSLLHCSCKS